MRLILSAALACSLLVGCSAADPLNAPGPVQTESPPPSIEEEGPSSFQIDATYKSIRVRVWPILNPPAGDPYPVTTNRDEVSLRADSGIDIRDLKTNAMVGQASRIDFNFKTGRMLLDGQEKPLSAVWVISRNRTKSVAVEWKGQSVRQAYRGDFQIQLTQNRGSSALSQWGVINVVSLEDYMTSVVPSEVPSSFSSEAIKAQALAARSYAVFHMGQARRINRNWDVDPTTAFQSYRGSSVEISKITQAVIATLSQVITYDLKIIEAFFSSNSGGVTCSISECFRGTDRPFMAQKLDTPDVRTRPGGTYTATVTPAKIDRELQRQHSAGLLNLATLLPGYAGAGDVDQLEAFEVGPSGRVWRLAVRLKNGKLGVLTRSQSLSMRNAVGITSSLYSLPARGSASSQSVVGHGFGHGVGLSQWGADALGDSGYDYQRIIGFYYPGIQIETLDFL